MRKYTMVKSRSRKMRGGSKFTQKLKNWMGNVNKWLKRTKVLSTLGRAGVNKYAPKSFMANLAVDSARQAGYGKRKTVRMRRRRMGQRGASLAPVGGSIHSLAIRR